VHLLPVHYLEYKPPDSTAKKRVKIRQPQIKSTKAHTHYSIFKEHTEGGHSCPFPPNLVLEEVDLNVLRIGSTVKG
jgi:hypothetical protein